MTLSTLDLGSFFAFAETTGWPVLYGLNLDIALVDVTGLEAQYLWEAYKFLIAGFEFGNEPDLYSVNGKRPSSYTYEAFKREWLIMHNEVDTRYPGAVYSGPATASGTWVGAFARDRHGLFSTLTEHYYKLGEEPFSQCDHWHHFRRRCCFTGWYLGGEYKGEFIYSGGCYDDKSAGLQRSPSDTCTKYEQVDQGIKSSSGLVLYLSKSLSMAPAKMGNFSLEKSLITSMAL